MPYPSTSDAIEASLQGLVTTFPSLCTRTAFPNTTNSVGMMPRTYSFLKIGKGSGAARPAMLAVAGLHAREWAPPDAAVTFAGNLLTAYTGGAPFTIPAFTDSAGTIHGPVVTPAGTVKAIIEHMDLYLVPIANPDGRAFCMAAPANKMWRKNRAPLPPPFNPALIGVDLNRNFDIAWDFDTYYSAAAAADPNFSAHTSKDPIRDVYIGSSVFSVNETKNIKWLLDNFPITYFIDLHSFTGMVMHPWGIETLQTSDAAKNFHNAAFDHLRDGKLGAAYEEFFPNNAPSKLLDRHNALVTAMHDNIKDATGADYTIGTSADLYPCTGTSDDYAFSRQFLAPGAPAMYAFSVEFGDASEGFQPTPAQYPKVEREVHAALLAFVRYVGIWQGLVPSVVAPSSPSSKICFIATAAFGSADHPDVRFLRSWRDALKERRSTRNAIRLLEAAYSQVSPSIAQYLSEHEQARRVVRMYLLTPLISMLRRLFGGIAHNAN
jgi:murein tripeptide amidase MpaA